MSHGCSICRRLDSGFSIEVRSVLDQLAVPSHAVAVLPLFLCLLRFLVPRLASAEATTPSSGSALRKLLEKAVGVNYQSMVGCFTSYLDQLTWNCQPNQILDFSKRRSSSCLIFPVTVVGIS